MAVDHLHENAWWYLTGRPDLWKPFHRVCLSGTESDYLPCGNTLTFNPLGKVARTGYTALDGPHDTPAEIRKAYGLPDRYLLVGTAVRASTIPKVLWKAYFRNRLVGRILSGYNGPSYVQVLRVLKGYAQATGLALVGKGRWKHEDHWAHRLFDYYFDDEPTDPGRALRLMQGATAYAGGISGLAVEALAARVPTLNWAYYPPLLADHAGFQQLRQELWIDGIWQAPGVGQLFQIQQPDGWREMRRYLDLYGITGHFHPGAEAVALQQRVVGPVDGSASARVLEACGL